VKLRIPLTVELSIMTEGLHVSDANFEPSTGTNAVVSISNTSIRAEAPRTDPVPSARSSPAERPVASRKKPVQLRPRAPPPAARASTDPDGRPYACDQCNLRFTRPNGLSRHKSQSHLQKPGDPPPNPRGPGPKTCWVCGIALRKNATLIEGKTYCSTHSPVGDTGGVV
jgi:hypothetical protein